MFRSLKDAYASVVAALTGHAATILEADAKVREFYGLDEPDSPAIGQLPPAREGEPVTRRRKF